MHDRMCAAVGAVWGGHAVGMTACALLQVLSGVAMQWA
jgi:hypothetical protein